MEQQQAPTAAGEGDGPLTEMERLVLGRVLEHVCHNLVGASNSQLTGSMPIDLGRAARRMVYAAFTDRVPGERMLTVKSMTDPAPRLVPDVR